MTNLRLGACKVYFDGVSLGETLGGVEISIDQENKPLETDKYGKSPLDYIALGQTAKVKVNLAEITLKNLGIALPFGTTTVTRVTGGGIVGKSLLSEAKALVLHPMALADNDNSEDFGMFKAVVTSPLKLKRNNKDQTVLEVEFEGLIDSTKQNGSQLFFIGDSTGL